MDILFSYRRVVYLTIAAYENSDDVQQAVKDFLK